MATRPELHIAVAKTKSKASEYNDNFDMIMDFVDTSIGEAKDYVDGFMPSVTGQGGKFLTNDGTSTSWFDLLGSNNTFTGNNTFSGDITFSGGIQMPDSDAVGSAITTKAISKSGNGYLKMGNGIIIAWGGYAQSSSGSHSVSFPTAFTAVPKLTTQILLNTNATLYQPLIKSVTKTGFTYYTTHANEYTLMYVAVGY